ncbi:MAG: phosphoribosylamine--glycine ligase [Acidimicrobiales bacterium]
MTSQGPGADPVVGTDIESDLGVPDTLIVPGSAPPDTVIETDPERVGGQEAVADRDLGLLDVLLIGSGGREHALANTIAESPRLRDLFVAPGNPGTRQYNVALDVADFNEVVAFCSEKSIDLVVVGPEQPLVDGLADQLLQHGINCFGPSAAAAQLEGSKSFARSFAERHGIPGPANATFTDTDEALQWLARQDFDIVVKADGLAGGKGVVVPDDRLEAEAAILEFLTEGIMGDSGRTVVLEEKISGEELSIFGICSAEQIDPLGGLTAQDHKRVGEGDTGPNTGGMGAFAPVPGLDPLLVENLVNTFLVPVQAGMAMEGTPYVGVVYAGIMLTDSGPRLIEYNCRFGDPEAQVLLPLVDGDVLSVMYAAATSQTWEPLRVKPGRTAATVVVCAEGYPSSPKVGVTIPSAIAPQGARLIQAGTRDDEGQLVSSGGRVLNAVGVGTDLCEALELSYAVVDQLVGNGLFARRDIGWRYVDRGASIPPPPPPEESAMPTVENDAYAAAGVSLAAGAATTARISEAVKSTHDERVIAGLGSFGGVFAASQLVGMNEPLLVASTDGVGTKTMLAEILVANGLDGSKAWNGLGADIVNHGINDVLVQGAVPMFFLDTVAAAQLDPEVVGQIVDGMAGACREAGCVLLGGETAEMPGVLTDGSVDISGTMVGAVDRADLLPAPGISAGYALIGLKSSGLHTNGYSLARKVVQGKDLNALLPGGAGESLFEALLATHRSYLAPLRDALATGTIAALAHITGGGLVDNLPRVLPDDLGAFIDTSSWTQPALFQYLIKQAKLSREDAHQILNCGIGMVVVCAPDDVTAVQEAIPEETFVIGEVTATPGIVLS